MEDSVYPKQGLTQKISIICGFSSTITNWFLSSYF